MRALITAAATIACTVLLAQTQVRIINVKINDGKMAVQGNEQTYTLKNAKGGSDHVVLYDNGEHQVKVWFKVSTHDVAGSSVKDSAVNLIMQLQFFIAGQRQDERRVEKILHLEEERKASYQERFVVKRNKGDRSRTIEVSFDAELL